jgi:hypothetical protein
MTKSTETLITEVTAIEEPVTDLNKLMRKGLESASKLETTYTDKPASIGFVMGECLDVKDEINRLSLVTMNKADVDKAIKAYSKEWLTPDYLEHERQIIATNARYDHVIEILDRITLGGAVMFGVAMFTVFVAHYLL